MTRPEWPHILLSLFKDASGGLTRNAEITSVHVRFFTEEDREVFVDEIKSSPETEPLQVVIQVALDEERFKVRIQKLAGDDLTLFKSWLLDEGNTSIPKVFDYLHQNKDIVFVETPVPVISHDYKGGLTYFSENKRRSGQEPSP